jgi:hypothetical protein
MPRVPPVTNATRAMLFPSQHRFRVDLSRIHSL